MSDSLAIKSIRLPTVSYGPVPAGGSGAMADVCDRHAHYPIDGRLAALFAAICSTFPFSLLFCWRRGRMIELADGKTALGKLSFTEQLILARKVMIPVLLMMVAVSIAVFASGARWTGLYLLLGFDGVAFDQFMPAEWCGAHFWQWSRC